ncbi:hypothetical protein [Anoxynatronum buryatiense]|uniref:Probable RNA and SrmB-binding site of polymerase A n=1 Tax=Anoxynatronum buryatiense TaxID=489973 RepID=A0AA46AJM1_9CLOT|nr:hypothetical protein [Anoxynatronum buryatiense]SMP62653.1 Probable RNA and SrmB-binding site of polymerase A [Anoxynatronum buryatiense]
MKTNPTDASILMPLFRHLIAEGATPLLVGGCVRDQLLHRQVKDLDVVIFGLNHARLREALDPFGQVLFYGKSFPIYQIRGLAVEFSLPRTNSDVETAMPLEEAVAIDARHRDFTVNALYRHPLTQQLMDPLSGLADLQARRLRMTASGCLQEDPLRVYRAYQLISRLGLTIEPETLAAMKSTTTSHLPLERIMEELDKWLLAEDPLKGWEAMLATHRLPVPQAPTSFEPLFPVTGWRHQIPAVLAAALPLRHTVSDSRLLMWAVLMAPMLAAERLPTAEAVKRRDTLVQWFQNLSRHHGRTNQLNGLFQALNDFLLLSHQQPGVMRLCLLTEPSLLEALLHALQPLWHNKHHRWEMMAALRRFQKWRPEALPKPCISGNDLKELDYPADSTMGTWLAVAYQMQLEGVEKEAILHFFNCWKKSQNELQ